MANTVVSSAPKMVLHIPKWVTLRKGLWDPVQSGVLFSQDSQREEEPTPARQKTNVNAHMAEYPVPRARLQR